MKLRLAMLAVVSSLWAAAPISAQVLRGARDGADQAEPPTTMRYVNPLTIEDAGRIADPVVIQIRDRYYLYATGGLAWSSDNLVNWDFHRVVMPEGANITAPGAFEYQGYVYLNGNYSGLYRSRDPLGPFEYYGDFTDENGQKLDVDLCTGCRNGGVFDPTVFVDDDQRIYLYYAGRSVNGVYGVELDQDNPTKLVGEVKHFFSFEPSHIWERYGNHNEYSGVSWIEGPWMTKRDGTYYLQYAAPGTDYTTYAVGVYTSENPLGPFTYYEGSPILVHQRGMINGVGHHSVVEAPDGSVWAFYTLLYRNWNRTFERRIGMDPVGFDDEGNMFIKGPTETPQWAPGVQATPWQANDSGSIPLSEDKSYEVSSEAPGRDAPYAFDNNARTWWSPAEDDPQPSLTLDLGSATEIDPDQRFVVDSARIMFSLPRGLNREDAAPRIRQYTIEVSPDNETFTTVVDKTDNLTDNAVEFDDIEPIECRYVRLTLTAWPESAPPGVVEFTVFGRPGQFYPPAE